MITRYLEHFTQDEVDKAPGEVLTKDLPYGGNRPYVIGTLLRDSASGEYILWRKGGTEAHRLCIEHAPHELVEWTIATENMTFTNINLQQLTRNYPFAKVKRIGMIPLDAASGAVPSAYYDSAYCVSRNTTSSDLNDPSHWFTLAPEQCELKLTQTTPLTQPTYCELDALLYSPFFTDKVYFTNLHIGYSARGVVFYCVYELHDGLMHYPKSDTIYNGTAITHDYPEFKILFSSGLLKYICTSSFDGQTDNYNVRVNLYKYKYVPGGTYDGTLLWNQEHSTNTRGCFYNVSRLNYHFEYGSFLVLQAETNFQKYRGFNTWLRFTSEKFNS